MNEINEGRYTFVLGADSVANAAAIIPWAIAFHVVGGLGVWCFESIDDYSAVVLHKERGAI